MSRDSHRADGHDPNVLDKPEMSLLTIYICGL